MASSGLQSTLQFNCHRQTLERLPVLTSDYTTYTTAWALVILNDVFKIKDRASCFSKYSTQN